MILDFFSQKSQFHDDEPIWLTLEFDEPAADLLTWKVFRLNQLILTGQQLISSAESPAAIEIPSQTAGGYGIEVRLFSKGCLLDKKETAVAVIDDKTDKQIIRYGFLSDFTGQDCDHADIRELAKFHINTIQYYDWSYRPHQYIAPADEYQDLMGKPISLAAIRHKLEWAKKLGMRSIAYGAVYAAANDLLAQHEDWGMKDHANKQIRFIEKFCIMDISRECPWHDHIIHQYKDAVGQLGFDGIHMDTYGHPKWGVSPSRGNETIYLEDHLPVLIDDVRQTLGAENQDVTLIFNNVGNWPVDRTAKAGQDCVYIEVWPPYDRYHHIKQLIVDAKEKSGGKPVVLAAYLAPFRTGTERGAYFAARILSSIIFAQGGTHLLLGEKDGVLTQGYYVDHSFLSAEQKEMLRRYYDFSVRYQDLLYDHALVDVSMTHSFWDNVEYRCSGAPWSPEAEAGKLYCVCRQKPGLRTISLINLCGCAHDFWNEDQCEPTQAENLTIEVMLDGWCKKVWMASPDGPTQAADLYFETYENDKGLFARISIPRVIGWSLLVIEV